MERPGRVLPRFFPSALLIFSGCAHAPLGPDSLTGKNFAVVQAVDDTARICQLDGHRVGGILEGFYPTEITLTPGDHVLCTCYWQGSGFTSTYYTKLTAEAGHVYTLNDEAADHDHWRLARMWLVDLSSASAIVGEVQATRNEPIAKAAQPFRQSLFFTWSPPEQGDWFISSRNRTSLIAAARDGPSKFEISTIKIAVGSIPTLKTPDDMLEYVKKHMDSGPAADEKRFEKIESTLERFQAQKEECVRYHRVAFNKHPQSDPYADSITALADKIETGFRQERPVIVDTYGYVCRIPNNQNLSITFRYTRRSFDRQNEDALSAAADKSFSQLKF